MLFCVLNIRRYEATCQLFAEIIYAPQGKKSPRCITFSRASVWLLNITSLQARASFLPSFTPPSREYWWNARAKFESHPGATTSAKMCSESATRSQQDGKLRQRERVETVLLLLEYNQWLSCRTVFWEAEFLPCKSNLVPGFLHLTFIALWAEFFVGHYWCYRWGYKVTWNVINLRLWSEVIVK